MSSHPFINPTSIQSLPPYTSIPTLFSLDIPNPRFFSFSHSVFSVFRFFSSVARCTLHTFAFKVLSSCYLLSILLVICCPCLFVVMHLHLAPSPFHSSHTLSFVIISSSPLSLILFFQIFVSWRVMTYT